MTDHPSVSTKTVDLAATCLPARKGDHAYWRTDGVLKCRHCGTPSAEVPKVTIAGIELDACSEWAKRIQAECDAAGFHWKNDRYFKRLEDGSVRVRRFEWSHGTVHTHDWVIPPAEWASIVCSVSAAGETLERWQASQRFHDGQPDEPAGRQTGLMLSQAARLLREHAGDAHDEDVPDILRWLTVYDSRAAETKPASDPAVRPKDGEPYVGPAPILLGIGKIRVAICSDTDDPKQVARELVIYDDGDGPKPVGTPEPEHAGKRADQVGKVLARLRVMNAKGAMVFASDLMTVIENAARADDGFPETKAAVRGRWESRGLCGCTGELEGGNLPVCCEHGYSTRHQQPQNGSGGT